MMRIRHVGSPHQIGEWLGIIVDTIRMLFVIPEKEIVKLKSVLTRLINDFPSLRVKDVANVSGFFNFPHCCFRAFCQIAN